MQEYGYPHLVIIMKYIAIFIYHMSVKLNDNILVITIHRNIYSTVVHSFENIYSTIRHSFQILTKKLYGSIGHFGLPIQTPEYRPLRAA